MKARTENTVIPTSVIDDKLAQIYKKLIDKSWANSDTFEAYQNAWRIVEEEFNVGEFDWTKGQRPCSDISA